MPRKTKSSVVGFGGDRTRVLIEPANAAAAKTVHRQLKAAGGTKVENVADGFISAEIPAAEIDKLRNYGRVNVVPPKRFRRP